MYERNIVTQIVERLNESRRFIQIISGPRQTGKTTAVTQALERVKLPQHFVSADDPGSASGEWLRNEWELARLHAKENEAVLIIDEVQKVKNWSAIVKLLWDEDSRLRIPLKVVLTGSSTLLIQKGLSESLKGRFEVLHCPHWSYSECKDAFDYSLDDFLLFGGYP